MIFIKLHDIHLKSIQSTFILDLSSFPFSLPFLFFLHNYCFCHSFPKVRKHLQKSLEEGRDFNLILAMKTKYVLCCHNCSIIYFLPSFFSSFLIFLQHFSSFFFLFRVMTDGMKYCLATGNWGDRKNPSKAGVVQVINTLDYLLIHSLPGSYGTSHPLHISSVCSLFIHLFSHFLINHLLSLPSLSSQEVINE